MPFANLPDVKLYYEFSGAEHLPVLVFSNGLGTNLHMWDGQVEAFSQCFRILRYDSRGHGQSGVTPGPYTIEQLSWDVVRFLDVLHIERACFCGLSMGGMIGMFLGVNAPKRFHKLALCNTSSKFGTADTWNTRIQTVQSGGMKAVAPIVLDRWFTPGFRSSHPKETQAVLTMLESANPDGYVASCAAVRDMDLRDVLENIHVPCLVLTGSHDPAGTPEEGHFLTDSIAGAVYVELPASHLSNIEARDEFNRQVLQFLAA
jgi:3-oxoadipate enol-lactonase